MSYLGNKVRHIEYGDGTVIRENKDKIFVEFTDNSKYADNQYCFKVPEAFEKGHLKLFEVEKDLTETTSDTTDLASRNPNKYRDLYKKSFLDYINEDKIKRTGSPYKQDTVAVDAFFLEKHSQKYDFLEWMKSDDSMEKAKHELACILGDPNDLRIQQRAQGYYIALCKLRDYLKQRGVI